VKTFDAFVIGGGPAGATAAALLAQAGWAVAVAEKSPFPRDKVCGGYLGPTSSPLLERLGLSAAFERAAGPQIRRVGLFAGSSRFAAHMPCAKPPCAPYGRAISRWDFDAMLLARAAQCGAEVYQPCAVLAIDKARGTVEVRRSAGETIELRACVVIAAHGSWMPGPLATQSPRTPSRASDLIGFKSAFRGATLATDLMPLIAFRGGYGGMVNAGDGRTTFSFCVRRDVLDACRSRSPRLPAGEAVLRAITDECAGVRDALQGASREGPWLAAGPIRPAVRRFYRDGVFVIGNAAGEAHPVIAEGIGMAMQSAALLCRSLIEERQQAALTYESRWRAQFGVRVAASKLFAQLAMRPNAVTEALVRAAPGVLNVCARLSGKAQGLASLSN
jgi:flavin-dependent dehydrogenase